MLWKITTLDPIGYDEYDSFVVRAATAELAIILARDEETKNACGNRHDWVATPLAADGEPEVILGSFNAG